MKTEIAKYRVDGREFVIQVDANTGLFFAALNETGDESDWIRAPSLKALQEKLKARARVVPVKFPVTILSNYDDDRTFKHGFITGIHGGNGNPVFLEDGDARAQQLRYSREVYGRFTAAEEVEYLLLMKAVETARAKLAAFRDARKIAKLSKALDDFRALQEKKLAGKKA